MNSFTSQLEDSSPAITRTVTSMPVNSWIASLTEDGGCIIPVYTSKKKNDNPEGYKFSQVREILANPSLIMDVDTRIKATAIFENLLYTLGRNKEGWKEMYLFYEIDRQWFETRRFLIKTIDTALRTPTTKSDQVQKAQESFSVSPKASKSKKHKK